MDENVEIRIGKLIKVNRSEITTQNRKDAEKLFKAVSGDLAEKALEIIIQGMEAEAGSPEAYRGESYMKMFKDKIFKSLAPEKALPKDSDDLDPEKADEIRKILDNYDKTHGRKKELEKGKDFEVKDDLGI